MENDNAHILRKTSCPGNTHFVVMTPRVIGQGQEWGRALVNVRAQPHNLGCLGT
jgi:hypothetical protein